MTRIAPHSPFCHPQKNAHKQLHLLRLTHVQILAKLKGDRRILCADVCVLSAALVGSWGQREKA